MARALASIADRAMALPRTFAALRAAALAGAAAIAATPASAFDADDAARFVATGSCPGCDLSDYDFTETDLGDIDAIDLRGADLSDADLMGADLSDAILAGAVLVRAIVDTADLSRADLRGADLTNAAAAFTRFDDADLSGAVLSGLSACYDQSFAGANMRGVVATDAVMCAGVWTGAHLDGADFSGSDLTLAGGLTQSQLDTACGSATTRLDGLSIPTCD